MALKKRQVKAYKNFIKGGAHYEKRYDETVTDTVTVVIGSMLYFWFYLDSWFNIHVVYYQGRFVTGSSGTC